MLTLQPRDILSVKGSPSQVIPFSVAGSYLDLIVCCASTRSYISKRDVHWLSLNWLHQQLDVRHASFRVPWPADILVLQILWIRIDHCGMQIVERHGAWWSCRRLCASLSVQIMTDNQGTNRGISSSSGPYRSQITKPSFLRRQSPSIRPIPPSYSYY